MSRIFLSHASANNAEAIALRDWLVAEGWSDLFLDLDPDRGLKAGERWQDALKTAAHRCEAVIILISPAWARSKWCIAEFLLAKTLNKRIFAAIVEPTPFVEMPIEIAAEWQIVDLTAGRRDRRFTTTLPIGDTTAEITFTSDGLSRLRIGLQAAGVDARFFAWPPKTDPKRAPYRGLRPLEADDAGIFFGREAPVIEAIDRLRGLKEAAPPRLMVILGASGAGKSSFLRAGLLPRLARDPQTFLPLPVIRPERAAISGEVGLVAALAGAFEARALKVARGEIREAVAGGAARLKPLLARLRDAARSPAIEGGATSKPPTLVLAIDQGEELFLAEGQGEAQPFLALFRDIVISDNPAVIAIITIRSDNYERLQSAAELDGVYKTPLDLGPMPKGSYAEVIKGPIRRLEGTAREIRIDDALVDALLADIEVGGAKDALPLLAFTLERLYEEYGATHHLMLDHYVKMGRVKGSIEAAVGRALAAADKNSQIPRDREARLKLLRRGLIPWLAGIDPDTKAPRRRVARISEIPPDARPLVDLLVEQRLLSTDVANDTGEATIEPAHEALLRQWTHIEEWLREDSALLSVLDGVNRATRDWLQHARGSAWLSHLGDRLQSAHALTGRSDLAAGFLPEAASYLSECRQFETASKRRVRRAQAAAAALFLSLMGVSGMAYTGILDRSVILVQTRRLADIYWPTQLTPEAERRLKVGDRFKECTSCPEMVVVPQGHFLMGTAEPEGRDDERPQRKVTIPKPFAVSIFEVTFDQWDGCVAHGGCNYEGKGESWGRGNQPATRMSWNDASMYVSWLARQTGRPYRLLTESEWEYAARAGTTTRYAHGDDISSLGNYAWFKANSQDRTQTVGSKQPNAFGIYDTHGNVWEWVQDCYADSYEDAPVDGTAFQSDECSHRILRGGSWLSAEEDVRPAARYGSIFRFRSDSNGFRVARTLNQP